MKFLGINLMKEHLISREKEDSVYGLKNSILLSCQFSPVDLYIQSNPIKIAARPFVEINKMIQLYVNHTIKLKKKKSSGERRAIPYNG